MQPVSLLSDRMDVDPHFIAAVAKIAGATDILLLDSWCGADPVTKELAAPPRQAAVYVERLRRAGRFGLDVSIYGRHRIEPNMSEAQVIRALARELRCSFVTSDCDANPWSWLRFDADGAIFRVFTCPDAADGEPSYDLACDLPADDPHYLPQRLVLAPNEDLPQKPADAPDLLPAEHRTFCLDADAAKLCETFWGACPYLRQCE